MFFNHFQTMSNQLQGNKSLSSRFRSFTAVNDWVASKQVFTNSTEINGFVIQLDTRPSGNINLTVGITTSLGPSGLFPYTISQELLNSNVGIAKTIAFEYSITASLTTGSTFGDNYESLIRLSGSAFTFQAYTPYWVGVRCDSADAGAACTLADMANLNSTGGNQYHVIRHSAYFQRLSSAIGVTHTEEYMLAIPFYSNISTGSTSYYSKYPYINASYNTSLNNLGKEFGQLFEFNNFPLQDWTVPSITISYLDPGAGTAYSAEYCMRLYDGPNFDNIVGTSITVYAHDATVPNFDLGPAEFEFLFNPPLRLRTNQTYFAGIAWSYQFRPDPPGVSNIFGIINNKEIQSKQSSVLAYRNSVGSGSLTTITDAKLSLSMIISNTKSGSRAIGN